MTPDVFASTLRYPEGPAFNRRGELFVVELGGGRVSRITADGDVSTFAQTGGSPNGSAFGPDGLLYVCNNGGRHPPAPSTDGRAGSGDATPCIQRIGHDGSVAVVLDGIDGVALNAPNDICFDDHGGMYFSDPSWEFLDDGMAGPGTLCYVSPAGAATRLHTGLRFPNGVGLTADESALLVTESSTGDLWTFPIVAPGELDEPSLFASCGPQSLPDGLAIDQDGTVLVASHGTDQLFVFASDGGPRPGVGLGQDLGLSNLCFGGAGGRTVYVTAAAQGTVFRFEWPVRGLLLGSE